MKPTAFTAEDIGSLQAEQGLAVSYRIVDSPDSWFDLAYRMLQEEFDRKVLDPRERYREWLELTRLGKHPFPYLLMTAYCRDGDRALLAGVISGNLMPVPLGEGGAGVAESTRFIFAIGHQLTSLVVRQHGIRGVGTRLLNAAIDQARRVAEELHGSLAYSLVEADGDALGYWVRRGYMWPQGIRYWQPPLEFDANGDFVKPEVPEILLLRPLDRVPDDRIERGMLQAIVATVYRNWSLESCRTRLSEEAFGRAESYVMENLLGRIRARMPQIPDLKLVRLDVTGTDGTKHRRSIALSQGIQHGMRPLRAPKANEILDFDGLLASMSNMAFGARSLGDAAEAVYDMATDQDCTVVLTLSGAVTIAKLDMLIAEMIERGMIQAVVSTGAILCHGFNAERGTSHFRVPDGSLDAWLFEQGYDRIYDTIETEFALDEFEEILSEILQQQPADSVMSSHAIIAALGHYLVAKKAGNGLIQAAVRNDIPVFVPAFTDSEIGLDFALYNRDRRKRGLKEVQFDPFLDFERYRELVESSKVLGLITLGGGVPRNWAQQIAPYLDAIRRRENAVTANPVRFKYGVRICPEPAHWGGLSGSTYSEAVSWGKVVPADEGGRFVEVLSDFSLAFPVLVKGVFERLDRRRP